MKGALLNIGGSRGANIALMVEVVAAGLTGANWSLDAPSFASVAKPPGAGLFVVAIAPKLLAPDFAGQLGTSISSRGWPAWVSMLPAAAQMQAAGTSRSNCPRNWSRLSRPIDIVGRFDRQAVTRLSGPSAIAALWRPPGASLSRCSHERKSARTLSWIERMED